MVAGSVGGEPDSERAFVMWMDPSRLPLYERLWGGPMFQGWHWLRWNFTPDIQETHFAAKTLDALLTCDKAMPGFADDMLGRLALMGGRERSQDDYEAILQWLAELSVILHFVEHDWQSPVTFIHEPTLVKNGPNPEIMVNLPSFRLGVEVKAPRLDTFSKLRSAAPYQLMARVPSDLVQGEITLPRDNPVKDFLQSADKKFAGFRQSDEDFRSVLIIAWDDFINEPISALKSPMSGLLTPNSFDKSNGKPRTYPNVDAVVLLRHQHQLRRGTNNEPPLDDRNHFLDYGGIGRFPPNVLIANEAGMPLPAAALDSLQAEPIGSILGAEYQPAEAVIWTGEKA
jgi:hypothetical protein